MNVFTRYIKMSYIVLFLLFAGCANNNKVAYESNNASKINSVLEGKIIKSRSVYIKDSGTGTTVGAVIGGVLGSTIGEGDGSTLAALGGGILGAIVGSKINESNAQELTVKLVNNEIVVVISKETTFQVGDNIRIVKNDNDISNVYKID